jgi:hypothetical protein
MALQWMPEETVIPVMDMASPSRALRIIRLDDARGLKMASLIGENVQDVSIPVRSTNSVEDFATSSLKSCLSSWGVKISPDADLVLRGAIVTLFVTEANKYKADARIRFWLEDLGGNRIWEGVVAGDASTWGSDLNPENYNQAISDALKKAYANLLSNAGFQRVWSASPSRPVAERSATAQKSSLSPVELREAIEKMAGAGVDAETISVFLRGRRLSSSLSGDDVVAWKKAGIPNSVIRDALELPVVPREQVSPVPEAPMAVNPPPVDTAAQSLKPGLSPPAAKGLGIPSRRFQSGPAIVTDYPGEADGCKLVAETQRYYNGLSSAAARELYPEAKRYEASVIILPASGLRAKGQIFRCNR